MIKKISILCLVFTLTFLTSFAQTISKEEFASRRDSLIQKLDAKSIAVFRGADRKSRNADENHQHRQLSDFYYLTGYEEPGAAFLLNPDGAQKFIVFFHEKRMWEELFGGKGLTATDIMNIYGADTAYSIEKFDDIFRQLLRGKKKIYFSFGEDKEFNEKITARINSGQFYMQSGIEDPKYLVHELRIKKSENEIAVMQKAIDITCQAHEEIMKAVKPGTTENKLQGIAKYVFYKEGSSRWGFPEIISSGDNLSTLHYSANNQRLSEVGLVMADMGAEYNYYSADVTRTFPVNGKFTEEQAAIYEAALASTDATIEAAKPGVTFQQMQNAGLDVLKEGLFDLGLITDVNSRWQWTIYMLYGQSCHWLGMDTHDVGDYKWSAGGRALEPGMVIAVEPGIYVDIKMFARLPELVKMYGAKISEDELKTYMDKVRPAVEKYNGICCRVEDDILITETGVKNLSANLAREIDEIEKLISEESIFE